MTKSLLDVARLHAESNADEYGIARTYIPGLTIVRETMPSALQYAVYKPLVAMVLQGGKRVTMGNQNFDFGAGESMLITADVPTVSQITRATIVAPYLSLVFELDPMVIESLVVDMGSAPFRVGAPVRVDPTDAEVADAALRLMRLLERPASVPILQDQLLRELHFWLLCGRHGGAIRSLGVADSHTQRISRAIGLIRDNLAMPLRIEHLAGVASMSVSSFHEHFRAITSLSPLQFQKQLRLMGMELGEGVVDVTATAKRLGVRAPTDMDDLLQNGRGAELSALIEAISRGPSDAVFVRAQDLSFAPLVTRPEKIICIGFNYRRHAEETGTRVPKAPPIFCKFRNALNRHEGEIKLPTEVDYQFDYETELVIVFGRECRNVGEDEALDYVAGYATGNDFSARQLQMATSQFTAGKTADGFAPIGPWLAPRQRIPDPNALRLTTRVNGRLRQDWTTADMVFNCRQLIAHVSSVMTVKPGDVLFTGTPQGVILGEKIPPEQRRWLRAGDEVVSELEGLGALKVTLA